MSDSVTNLKYLPKPGIIALPGLLEVIESVLDYCEIIEVEPQTFWRQDGEGNFSVNTQTLKRIKSWGKPITLHGVGTPVGGSLFLLDSQLTPLLQTIEILEPLWITEHLSFNRCPEREQFTGFFLPPIQTQEAVEIAAKNLSVFHNKLGIPVGFETGVNYFPKTHDQLSDGEFFKAVADAADCSILLDIHNLWCNERNGRDSVSQVLQDISFDKVNEVHLAGGESFFGYYLDSHSTLPDPQLLGIFNSQVLPCAENLRSVIFEITSTNYLVNGITTGQLKKLLIELRQSIDNRKINLTATPYYSDTRNKTITATRNKTITAQPVVDWEQSLVDMLFMSRKDIEKQQIPGIELYRKLIDSARLGSLTKLCTLTVRLCMIIFGPDKTRIFFQEYLDQSHPALTSEQESKQFVKYINTKESIPLWLNDALAIDSGRVEASNTLKNVKVTLSINPYVLFNSARNNLSDALEPDGKAYHLELQP